MIFSLFGCMSVVLTTSSSHECAILDEVHRSGLGKFGLLALRAIIVKDVHFLTCFLHSAKQEQLKSICGALAHLRAGENLCKINCWFLAEARRGCDDSGVYRGDNYSTIYNLIGHTSDRKPADLFRRTVGALYLTHLLYSRTSFFGDGVSGDSVEVLLVASLLLRHLQSFPCNAHEISELRLDRHNVAESLSVEIGAAIYGALSLFNHSCDPMVTRHFYGDTCVVRTVRSVARGSELSDNYGAVYAVQSGAERRAKLRNQYYFECQCVACVRDWPLYPTIPHKTPVLVCPACRTELEDDACASCDVAIDTTEVRRVFALSTEKYQFALKKLLLTDIKEAIRNFTKALALFENCVQLPWRDFNNAQEGLKQCYNIEGNVFLLPDTKKQ